MSRRTAPGKPGLDPMDDPRTWFGLTEESRSNGDLIVRRRELFVMLERLERAKRKNTALRRFGRWLAGKALVDLNPYRIMRASSNGDGRHNPS